jgi:TatD DNase family protein
MQFNLHTHHPTNQKGVLELVNQYPQEFDATIPFYSIGIHPWFIDCPNVETHLQIIERNLKDSACLAVGECGLDKRIDSGLEVQQLVFERQLLLAQTHQKPVVVHCVAAFQELVAIKKRLNITVPMIIHGFSKNKQVAKNLIDHDFYLSFGKQFWHNPELETVFKTVPEDRFFLETDTMEQSIEEVYVLGARYKKWSMEQLQEQIMINFATVFLAKNR